MLEQCLSALHARAMSFVENQIVHLARSHCVVQKEAALVLPDSLTNMSAALSPSKRSLSLKHFAEQIQECKRPDGHYNFGVLVYILRALNIHHASVNWKRVEDKVVAIHNEEAAAEEAAAANDAATVLSSRDDQFAELSYDELLANARELAAQVENHKNNLRH